VVHVIPLLVETGQHDDFHRVVVVDTDPETQLARLRSRDGLSVEAAQARLDAQASREDRRAAADVVLSNTGSVSELYDQIARLWAELNEPDAGN